MTMVFWPRMSSSTSGHVPSGFWRTMIRSGFALNRRSSAATSASSWSIFLLTVDSSTVPLFERFDQHVNTRAQRFDLRLKISALDHRADLPRALHPPSDFRAVELAAATGAINAKHVSLHIDDAF